MGEVKHDGGPAFPHGYSAQANSMPGMSLRDWFAGQALAGICGSGPSHDWTNDRIARDAYELADAMIEARKATPSLHEGERDDG